MGKITQLQPSLEIKTLTPTLEQMGVGSKGFINYVEKVMKHELNSCAGLIRIRTPENYEPRSKTFESTMCNILKKPQLQRVQPDPKNSGAYILERVDYPSMTVSEYENICESYMYVIFVLIYLTT
jgi:hypothetical protein